MLSGESYWQSNTKLYCREGDTQRWAGEWAFVWLHANNVYNVSCHRHPLRNQTRRVLKIPASLTDLCHLAVCAVCDSTRRCRATAAMAGKQAKGRSWGDLLPDNSWAVTPDRNRAAAFTEQGCTAGASLDSALSISGHYPGTITMVVWLC